VAQRVIIRVRPGRRLALAQQLVSRGNRVVTEHPSLEAITAVVRGEDLGPLADADDVLSISADAVVRPSDLIGGLLGTVTGVVKVVANVLLPNGADTSGPAVQPSTLRATLGIANSSWTGRGVGVAVVDSGLEMSAEFQGRVTAFYDFTGGGTVATSPYDDYGHGTHVSGTIGGSGALSASAAYRGLAPQVRIVALKVLDKNGAGYTSDVIRAIDFAVANKSRLGIDLLNLSLGHPIAEPAVTDPLVQAVERASRAGIIVVAAAGNYGKNPTTGKPGYAGITSPGNAPSAITVGAARTDDTVSRNDDRIPDYSSAGPSWYDAYVKPDVVSPGHNIVAVAAKHGTLYQTYPQLKAADGDYMRLSGTSMATAVTTGSIALMLEANRAAAPGRSPLTPNAVKAVLEYTTVDIHNDPGCRMTTCAAPAP
jgi:serine protease AprX